MTPPTARLTALVAAAALLLPATPAIAVQPVTPLVDAAADTTEVAAGTATSSSTPLSISVGDVDVVAGRSVVGATTDLAASSLAPFASTTMTLLDVDGTTFGDLEVRSDGVTNAAGAVVDETTPVGQVVLIAGELTATADEATASASSTLERLDIATQILNGLSIGTAIDGAAAAVDPDAATASHGLAVTDIDVAVGTILGDVLDLLPLADLLAIADDLGVALPTDLTAAQDVVAATQQLVDSVAAAGVASDDIVAAADAFAAAEALDPLAGYGDIAAYESLLASLEAMDPIGDPAGTLTALAALLADADYLALSCGEDTPTLLNLEVVIQQAIDCIQAHLDAYAAAVAALLPFAQAVQDAVDAYAAAVADALAAATVLSDDSTSLTDVLDSVLALIADLEGTNIVSLAGFGVTQEVTAIADDLAGSSATSTCEPTTLTVLALPAIDIPTCEAAQVQAVLDAATAVVDTITDVLEQVGGVDLGDGVSLEILQTVANSVSSDAATGQVTAVSQVEVLRLDIPSITVTPCDVADGLVCSLGLDLGGPLLDTLDGLEVGLTDAQAAAETALTAVSGLLDTVLGAAPDVVDEVGADAIVDAAIGVLEGVLGSLDLGELGDGAGITLPGASVVIDPEVTAVHVAGAAVTPAPDTGDDPTLPNTGGGAVLLAVLALGGAALIWRRGRDD